MSKITKLIVHYPEGEAPNFVQPADYRPYRFVLGRLGPRPLVVIGMNPSAAREETSDRTVNRFIRTSQKLGYDGWIAFNTYPERATDAVNLDVFDEKLVSENLAVMREILTKYRIIEVWGAWGDLKYEALVRGRDAILGLLTEMGIKVFHFAPLTKAGNPRHPLYLKIEAKNKRYL